MDEIEQNLRAYEDDPAAARTIRDTITDAYRGLKPELETIHKYETEQLPAFYNAYSGYGMGTGAADLDPTARMQMASGDVARKSALARTARDIFDTRRAGMEDLIKAGIDQWQTGYGMAQNRWGREMEGRKFDESVRQFDLSHDLMQRQFDESVRQFGMTYALEERKLNESINQFNQQMEYQYEQLNQMKYQFEKSHGLERERLATQISQFEKNLAEQTRQFNESLALDKQKLAAQRAATEAAKTDRSWIEELISGINTTPYSGHSPSAGLPFSPADNQHGPWSPSYLAGQGLKP